MKSFCCSNCGLPIIEVEKLDGYVLSRNDLLFQRDDFDWNFICRDGVTNKELFKCTECHTNFDATIDEYFVSFDQMWVFVRKQVDECKLETPNDDWRDLDECEQSPKMAAAILKRANKIRKSRIKRLKRKIVELNKLINV